MGQYRSNFKQACFPLAKVQVIVPRPGAPPNDFPDETDYKGRFFFCIVDNHIKFIDTELYRLFDLLTEPNFDQEAVQGVGLSRAVTTRKNKLLILCFNKTTKKSYVQRVDFNGTLPTSLNARTLRQNAAGKL